MTERPLLTRKQAAELLGITSTTLANWEADGKGPAFIRISAKVIRYQIEDIRSWLERNKTNPEQSGAECA